MKSGIQFSIAEVRILKNIISFNVSAASELGYPAFVRVFISHDKTQIALQPCDKTTTNAMKFFTTDNTKRRKKRTIGVGNKALAALINLAWAGIWHSRLLHRASDSQKRT